MSILKTWPLGPAPARRHTALLKRVDPRSQHCFVPAIEPQTLKIAQSATFANSWTRMRKRLPAPLLPAEALLPMMESSQWAAPATGSKIHTNARRNSSCVMSASGLKRPQQWSQTVFTSKEAVLRSPGRARHFFTGARSIDRTRIGRNSLHIVPRSHIRLDSGDGCRNCVRRSGRSLPLPPTGDRMAQPQDISIAPGSMSEVSAVNFGPPLHNAHWFLAVGPPSPGSRKLVEKCPPFNTRSNRSSGNLIFHASAPQILSSGVRVAIACIIPVLYDISLNGYIPGPINLQPVINGDGGLRLIINAEIPNQKSYSHISPASWSPTQERIKDVYNDLKQSVSWHRNASGSANVCALCVEAVDIDVDELVLHWWAKYGARGTRAEWLRLVASMILESLVQHHEREISILCCLNPAKMNSRHRSALGSTISVRLNIARQVPRAGPCWNPAQARGQVFKLRDSHDPESIEVGSDEAKMK
ncbi:hypothetical protein B0H17DRAFT_1135487 [Mycena rosella]|uniref:Uncharacterized protein n=1 Tax=Mycena rosella TaxID=1033263 RepID=A0AAD7DDH4_MYCRO|nr:hypothetical protein B0H17DRAFT_1135487 [Mycena rosella]